MQNTYSDVKFFTIQVTNAMKIPEKTNHSVWNFKYAYMVQKGRHSNRVHRPFCDISLDEGQRLKVLESHSWRKKPNTLIRKTQMKAQDVAITKNHEISYLSWFIKRTREEMWSVCRKAKWCYLFLVIVIISWWHNLLTSLQFEMHHKAQKH